MSADYRPMWTKLGLNLEKHDLLLQAVGQMYTETFLSQRHRPEGMAYFDFVMSEVHGLRIQEIVEARDAGRIVVGSFCTYVPEELILALDGVSVGLCAGAEWGTDAAERYVPRNTCSLIKSAFGFSVDKVCPYLAVSTLIVGENTCDGKKKAWERFAELVPNFHVIDLPQKKSEEGRALLRKEYQRFAEKLVELAKKPLTVEKLKAAIQTVNAKRLAMHRLDTLRQADPAPISGLDVLLANQVFFYDDPVRFTTSVNKICDELEARIAKDEGVAPKSAPRLVVSGCPMAVPNWKIHSIVEQAGGVVVGDESCVGARGTQGLTNGSANTIEGLLDALVDRYLGIDCAIFSPNPTRLEHLQAIAKGAKADGVLLYTLQFCTPYLMESQAFETKLETGKVPALRIDTDYSNADTGQLKTRIEAFLERIAR